MKPNELFPGGNIEYPDEVNAKPYSSDQTYNDRKIPLPACEVREVIEIMQSYKLGNLKVSLNTYARRIEHYDNMRVWSARRGIELFPRIKPKITKFEDQKRLELIVEKMHQALESTK